ncbi:hypothetical protein AMTRI_Chr09g22560 [Amborella trichopoda]
MALPPFDAERAESSRQHVVALNTQFASWVQSQLKNHPDALWMDGVQDYIRHASRIMEEFSDIVGWLRENAAAANGVTDANKLTAKNRVLPEIKTQKLQAQVPNTSGSNPSGPSMSFVNPWGAPPASTNQISVFPGTQSATLTARETSDNVDEGDEVEQPSSPSLKKTEEQGVRVVHEVKCKLYIKPDDPVEKGWKDMGMGQLSIKCVEGAAKATKESKPTIIIRNHVGKVLLNALIYPSIRMNIQKNTIATIFHTSGDGFSGGTETGKDNDIVVARTYLLRMKSEEETNKLAEAIKVYTPVA